MPTGPIYHCAESLAVACIVGAVAGTPVMLPAEALAGQDAPVARTAPSTGVTPPAPTALSTRVGGDLEVTVTFEDGVYRTGECRIPTPLPEGYPAPTPPGAIDLKNYPVVRRAEVDGAMSPDLGMNMTFWPLFRHISRRDIAMTSPVEIDYEGFDPAGDELPERWTMAFLYRTCKDGPKGVDRSVRIVDAQPLTVVSLGFTGGTSIARVRDQLAALDRWLESRPDLTRVGEPRALFYNGPEVPERHKWVEVQFPVALAPAAEGQAESVTSPTQQAEPDPAGPDPAVPSDES